MGHSIEHHEHMGACTTNELLNRSNVIEQRLAGYCHAICRYVHDGFIEVEMIKADPFVQFLCAQHEELRQRAISISREVIIR